MGGCGISIPGSLYIFFNNGLRIADLALGRARLGRLEDLSRFLTTLRNSVSQFVPHVFPLKIYIELEPGLFVSLKKYQQFSPSSTFPDYFISSAIANNLHIGESMECYKIHGN